MKERAAKELECFQDEQAKQQSKLSYQLENHDKLLEKKREQMKQDHEDKLREIEDKAMRKIEHVKDDSHKKQEQHKIAIKKAEEEHQIAMQRKTAEILEIKKKTQEFEEQTKVAVEEQNEFI